MILSYDLDSILWIFYAAHRVPGPPEHADFSDARFRTDDDLLCFRFRNRYGRPKRSGRRRHHGHRGPERGPAERGRRLPDQHTVQPAGPVQELRRQLQQPAATGMGFGEHSSGQVVTGRVPRR